LRVKKGQKNNKGNQQNTQKETKTAEPKNQSHENFEISDELDAKIDWLSNQFGYIRQWTGQDNGEYATITPKSPKEMPEGFNDVGEVAEDIMDELTELAEDAGEAIYATYDIRYGKTKGVGRLIKVNDERRLTFALEVEHQVTSAKGGVTSFKKRDRDEDNEEEAQASKTNFGFGKKR